MQLSSAIFAQLSTGVDILFIGHLESDFRDRESVTPARIVDRERIVGCGIWNMKGAMAAYLAALLAVRKAGIDLPGDVLIAGVAGLRDETLVETRLRGEAHQGFSFGTKYFLAHGGAADLALTGEPTSFQLVQQHFGTAAVRVDIKRKETAPYVFQGADLLGARSVRFPLDPLGSDAIHVVAQIVEVLRAWIPDYQGRNVIDGKAPQVTFSAIEGGSPGVPVAAKSSSLFVFIGTAPRAARTVVLDEIRPLVTKVLEGHTTFEATTELYSIDPGAFVPDDSPIVRALESAHEDVFGTSVRRTIVGWHSDASPLVSHGIATVNYGLAGEWQISSRGVIEGEFVRVDDLVRCARVYTDLIVRVCGEPRA